MVFRETRQGTGHVREEDQRTSTVRGLRPRWLPERGKGRGETVLEGRGNAARQTGKGETLASSQGVGRGLQDTQAKKGIVGGEVERDAFLSPHSTTTNPSAILPTRLHHHSRPLGFVILEGAARSNRKSVFRRTCQREPREAGAGSLGLSERREGEDRLAWVGPQEQSAREEGRANFNLPGSAAAARHWSSERVNIVLPPPARRAAAPAASSPHRSSWVMHRAREEPAPAGSLITLGTLMAARSCSREAEACKEQGQEEEEEEEEEQEEEVEEEEEEEEQEEEEEEKKERRIRGGGGTTVGVEEG
ncbi:hypothetical protein Pcinc_039811 [Petrolisthes cinctipes]|uniref:Uncharacterized protein n=1 Tax=Petrolisthes cinctipes TaxID=88211 RepID=A0AAE1BRM7_PETCI|nr:hypothetical protein Pcinc_039811 [Petrolisthes cinctipes]